MTRLRPVKPASATAFAYTNRMGETYYLHEGTTKTGKPRYFFAKTIRDGALTSAPPGFEVSESINGVVSIRRKGAGASAVPAEDVALVEEIVGKHRHLRGYMVHAASDAVVVFEPHPRPGEAKEIAGRLGITFRAADLDREYAMKARYAPVMKFERAGDAYAVRRMTYRGEGGWSWPLRRGPLAELAKRFVPAIGTDDFFELM